MPSRKLLLIIASLLFFYEAYSQPKICLSVPEQYQLGAEAMELLHSPFARTILGGSTSIPVSRTRFINGETEVVDLILLLESNPILAKQGEQLRKFFEDGGSIILTPLGGESPLSYANNNKSIYINTVRHQEATLQGIIHEIEHHKTNIAIQEGRFNDLKGLDPNFFEAEEYSLDPWSNSLFRYFEELKATQAELKMKANTENNFKRTRLNMSRDRLKRLDDEDASELREHITKLENLARNPSNKIGTIIPEVLYPYHEAVSLSLSSKNEMVEDNPSALATILAKDETKLKSLYERHRTTQGRKNTDATMLKNGDFIYEVFTHIFTVLDESAYEAPSFLDSKLLMESGLRKARRIYDFQVKKGEISSQSFEEFARHYLLEPLRYSGHFDIAQQIFDQSLQLYQR